MIRLGWVGHIVRMEDLRIPKKFVIGNFIIQDQWENQEQDKRTLLGVTSQKTEKNGGVF
jgi:hypothetical protein